MGERIEVALLTGRETFHGITAELYERMRVGRQTTDAGRRDIVRFGGQSHTKEIVEARFDQAGVVGVDIAHEKPGAHAVVGEIQPRCGEFGFVAGEELLGLCGRIAAGAFHAHVPKMAIAAVGHRGHAVAALHVGTCEEIDPQTHFRTVERRLLDDRDAARVIGLHERSLVGSVAQIIAFQHRTGIGGQQLGAHQPQGAEQTLILLDKTIVARLHMKLNVVLARSGWGDIRRKRGGNTDFLPVFLQKVHCLERHDARRQAAFSLYRGIKVSLRR